MRGKEDQGGRERARNPNSVFQRLRSSQCRRHMRCILLNFRHPQLFNMLTPCPIFFLSHRLRWINE